MSPLFKVYKKVVEFSFTPTKNIFVFSFSFWFQFIQRIEHFSPTLEPDNFALMKLIFDLIFFKIIGDSQADSNQSYPILRGEETLAFIFDHVDKIFTFF